MLTMNFTLMKKMTSSLFIKVNWFDFNLPFNKVLPKSSLQIKSYYAHACLDLV